MIAAPTLVAQRTGTSEAAETSEAAGAREVPGTSEAAETSEAASSREVPGTSEATGTVEAVKDAIAALLTALGRDATSGPLAETPQRVATSLIDLLTPQPIHLTTFANPGGYAGPVIVHDIPFQSLCEHHLMPFRGVAHVGYIPAGRIVGLSTLPKVVEHFSRNLQLQERLTTDIADWLQRELHPAGVGVMVEAEQLCMSLRGVGTPDTFTTTSDFRGAMTRAQFLSPSRLLPVSHPAHP